MSEFNCKFSTCEVSFLDEISLQKHVQEHASNVGFICKYCGKEFSRKSSTNVHENVIHLKIKPFVCKHDGCGKTFGGKTFLNRHVLTHSKVKSFTCDICQESFARSDTLQVHQRIHTGERLYQCEQCDKCYAHLGTLIDHRLVAHAGNDKYSCGTEGCGYKTGGRALLYIHELRCNGIRRFSCDICDFTCVQSCGLTEHTRTHTGEKPFSCPVEFCTLAFSTSTSLSRHMLIHTGHRPYSCDVDGCTDKFNRKEALATHTFYNHTDEGKGRRRKQEYRIAKLLESNNILFKANHKIDFKCGMLKDDVNLSCCYIDFVIEIYNEYEKLTGIIFLEVDEHQHEQYGVACEVRRMVDVYQSLVTEGNTLPITFIRYNPDEFKVHDKKIKITKANKEKSLLKTINDNKFEKPFSTIYMYYDTIDEQPFIFSDPEYDDSLKICLSQCIYW